MCLFDKKKNSITSNTVTLSFDEIISFEGFDPWRATTAHYTFITTRTATYQVEDDDRAVEDALNVLNDGETLVISGRMYVHDREDSSSRVRVFKC